MTDHEHRLGKQSIWTRYGYGWVTLGFFVISLVGHWLFGWFAYVNEQTQRGAPIEVAGYTVRGPRQRTREAAGAFA